MQRIVIPFAGTMGSPVNNVGDPTQLTVSGRISAVQFNLVGTDGSTSAVIQLSSSPVFVSPIQQSGLNPQEIAEFGFTYAAPIAAFVGAAGTSQMVPCDYPVTVGEQLFVNANGTGAVAFTGIMVIFIS
jgi:hypothetical protein